MSWEQRNADFCKAQTDAQMAYIEAEREVDRLQAENAKLFSLLKHESGQVEKLRELVLDMWDFFCVLPDDPHVPKEELDFSIEVWKRMRELGIEAEA